MTPTLEGKTELENLFRPITIAGIEIKNRIKMAPMAVGFAEDGYAGSKFLHFFEERARGGAGLVDWALWPYRTEHGYFPWVWDDKFIPGLKRVVAAVHKHGAKIIAQLGTGYSWAFNDGPLEVVGPSGISLLGRPGVPIRVGSPTDPKRMSERAMTTAEIQEMVEGYGDAGRRIREAGFEGVELMLAAGYTLSRFISTLTNKRTDQYGGPLKNRMRVIKEIVDNIGQKAGPDFPVFVKISGAQFIEGGYTLEECASEIVPVLEEIGICAVDVIAGWHEAPVGMLTNSVPEGQPLRLAEAIKKKARIPIFGGGRTNDPRTANAAIAQGKIDMIVIGRQLLADPEFANKAREGQYDDIRPCICCNGCFDTVDTPIVCSVNPRLGKEQEYIIEKTDKPKKITVVGSGPGGTEAALVANKRGHRVILVEKETSLGGMLKVASATPFKSDIGRLVNFYRAQIEKSDIKVKLGKEANIDSISQDKPDIIIAATGATPLIPSIDGILRRNVVKAVDVILGRKQVGSKVIILGGGMVGCEVAEYLAQENKKVTIVELLDRIATDLSRGLRFDLVMRLRRAGIQIETDVKVTRISEHGVWGARTGFHRESNEVFFEGDTVVIALGMKAEGRLAQELEGKIPVYNIGDSVEPRHIKEAVLEGFLVAKEL